MENIVEFKGVRKVVFEIISFNDEDEFVVIGIFLEQFKSRSMFGLFGRMDVVIKNEGVGQEEEEEEEFLLLEIGEEGMSKGVDVVKGNGVLGMVVGGLSSGGGGVKKKNRCKKCKGGKLQVDGLVEYFFVYQQCLMGKWRRIFEVCVNGIGGNEFSIFGN